MVHLVSLKSKQTEKPCKQMNPIILNISLLISVIRLLHKCDKNVKTNLLTADTRWSSASGDCHKVQQGDLQMHAELLHAQFMSAEPTFNQCI